MAGSQPSNGTGVIGRVAQILRALAAHRLPMRLLDLSEAVALERSTVHRMLQGLVREGLVRQDPETRRYALGLVLHELGLAAGARLPLQEASAASLTRLAERTGDTAFLMVRSGDDAVCLDRREGSYPIKALTINVGDRRPLGAAAGSLALLMAMPPQEQQALIQRCATRYTQYGVLCADRVVAMLRESATAGFAINRDNIIPGVSGIGLPVAGERGEPIAALSVAAVSSRVLPRERRETILAALQHEARAVARELKLRGFHCGERNSGSA